MNLKFINSYQYSSRLKATIQATGKLGFTQEAATALGLCADKEIMFAVDEDDAELYMAILDDHDERAFLVRKSGLYYYLPTKLMFDALGVNYAEESIMYDLVRMPAMDQQFRGKAYKMKQRKNIRPMRKE